MGQMHALLCYLLVLVLLLSSDSQKFLLLVPCERAHLLYLQSSRPSYCLKTLSWPSGETGREPQSHVACSVRSVAGLDNAFVFRTRFGLVLQARGLQGCFVFLFCCFSFIGVKTIRVLLIARVFKTGYSCGCSSIGRSWSRDLIA